VERGGRWREWVWWEAGGAGGGGGDFVGGGGGGEFPGASVPQLSTQSHN